MVDISGVDKLQLLEALWSNQKTASFFTNPPQLAPGFDHSAATAAIARGYIDYFCGRAIKADLSGDYVIPYLYDRDAGPGALQRIVTRLRFGVRQQ
jgi:hypothetical protein